MELDRADDALRCIGSGPAPARSSRERVEEPKRPAAARCPFHKGAAAQEIAA